MKNSNLNVLEQFVCGNCSRLNNSLAQRSWASPWIILKVTDSLLRGIAQVCFANNPISGLLILVGLFVGDVRVGLGAVLCSLVAIAISKFTDQDDGAIRNGLTNFSAVLVGTVIPALYPLFFTWPFSWEIWVYMIVAAAFSVCVGGGLGVMLSKHSLPAFTLPFNVATSITFLCLRAKGYAEPLSSGGSQDVTEVPLEYDVDEAIQWSQVCLGTLLSAGQVYAVESTACSVLVLVGLMICSPILGAASYIGAIVGTFTALAVSSAPYTLVYAGVWGYNGFLSTACLLFFMEPTPRIAVMGVFNAVFTTFLQAAIIPVFAANNLPVFTFPFCLSSLLFLALTSSTKMGSNRVENPTYPERHLGHHMKAKGPNNVQDPVSISSNEDEV